MTTEAATTTEPDAGDAPGHLLRHLYWPRHRKFAARLGEWRGSYTGRKSPAAISTAPPATQTNIKLVEVAAIVEQVLGNASLSRETKRQLEIVQTTFGNIEATVKQAEVDQALAWVRMATTRGLQIAKLLKSLAPVRSALGPPKTRV